MAEVAPSAGGGGGGRNFLIIIGGLAAVLFIGLLALGAILFLPGLLGGGEQVAAVSTATPTRIVIPPTATRTPGATATLVVSNVPTPVLAPGERQVLIEVDDNNNNVTLTTFEGGKAPMVQTGTWAADTTTQELTLTFTTLNGKPFKDVIVLKIENGQLTPVSYNRALHGNISGVQFKRNSGPSSMIVPAFLRGAGQSMPAVQATATPNPVSGDYGGSIPPPGPSENLVMLTLNDDGSAVLSSTATGKASSIQLGTWKADGNVVTVNLTDKDGVPLQDTIVFELKGNQLVSTTLDETLHGASLVLTRDLNSPVSPNAPAAGTYTQNLNAPGTATPIPITATPIMVTATPQTGSDQANLPDTGLGEDLLLLFGGALLLVGIIVIVRRMRAT